MKNTNNKLDLVKGLVEGDIQVNSTTGRVLVAIIEDLREYIGNRNANIVNDGPLDKDYSAADHIINKGFELIK